MSGQGGVQEGVQEVQEHIPGDRKRLAHGRGVPAVPWAGSVSRGSAPGTGAEGDAEAEEEGTETRRFRE